MNDPRLILCGAAAFITVVVIVQYVRAVRRYLWRPTIAPGRRAERVSVIIPARNEAEDLAAALETILRQEDVEIEVIVVNDHSTDATGSIADAMAQTDPRIRVIHDPPLLPGWLGKCNAMQQAAAVASGDILLFTDADIFYAPRTLATALGEMEQRRLDLLSLFPSMDFVTVWEHALLPAIMGGLALFATPHIEDPRSSDAMAAGAFIMVRSRDLHALGGLDPIKHEMLDDVALFKHFKRQRRRVALGIAPAFLRVRLFKSNRHAFWGTTKNVLAGVSGRLWLAPVVILLPPFGFWTPIYCAIAGVFEANGLLVAAGFGVYVLEYGMILMGRTLFRFHAGKALLFPLVAIPVGFCMIRALSLHLFRGAVEWRGRTIRVHEARTGS